MVNPIIIGTRGSQLAVWQANDLKYKLEHLGHAASLKVIQTKGDQLQHLSLDKMEGKGFFTREIEEALLREEVDIAVHSMKDLPTTMDEQLTIAGVSERADPADWLIIGPDAIDLNDKLSLKKKAFVGTSSNRRKAQICHIRDDLQTVDIRGNVTTRLDKLQRGQIDALVLAAAGPTRLALDLSAFKVVKLHPREFVPAPAQGVMAYQIKSTRNRLREILKPIHHEDVAIVTTVERKILKILDGGCHLPLGAFCETDPLGYYHVWVAYATSLTHPIKHVNLSLSTVDGLAESIIDQLQNS